MARWLTAYIDQNHEKWTREALENQKTENQRAAEWHRMERFEKIRIIREKQEENRQATVKIKPAVLTLSDADQQTNPSRPGEAPQDQDIEQQDGLEEQTASSADAKTVPDGQGVLDTDAIADTKPGDDDHQENQTLEQPSQ